MDTHGAVFNYLGKEITPRYLWAHFDDKPRENYYSKVEDRYFLHNAAAIYGP